MKNFFHRKKPEARKTLRYLFQPETLRGPPPGGTRSPGAPFGVAVIVPAVTGPFDLGTVVVRQALYINSTTAQVTVVSDPFPTIRDGIPLRIRRVSVTFDRPEFTLNPTSCDPMALDGTISTIHG